MAVLGPTCAHLNYSLGNCYFPHAQVPDISATKAQADEKNHLVFFCLCWNYNLRPRSFPFTSYAVSMTSSSTDWQSFWNIIGLSWGKLWLNMILHLFGGLLGLGGTKDTLKSANSIIRIKSRCTILFCSWCIMEKVNDAKSVLQCQEPKRIRKLDKKGQIFASVITVQLLPHIFSACLVVSLLREKKITLFVHL